MNTPATHDLSVLVERLLVLPPEQWEPELASAEASPAVRASVLAILNAVSTHLESWLPPTGNLARALQPCEPETGNRLPPLTIPGYEILGELGRGGMGIVYKARQLRLNRIVALKTIRAGADASDADRARFLAEAEAVASLQHPTIVTLYEFGQHDNLLHFTLEWVAGGSLAQKLADGPFEARQAAHLVEQVAIGIQLAHEQGILHRDLKPGNILLTADGTPKISDFGLAKRLPRAGAEPSAEQTTLGGILGTPSYMAPELAAGRNPRSGPAVDIYGLGVILYECLTGRAPFRGVTPMDTLRQVIAEDPVPPRRLNRTVPRDLETICLKCLHKEPQRRYASARALIEDLRRFRENRPILARPVHPVERALRWCRRNPASAALAAVTVLVLILLPLGGLWLWRAREIARLHARTADAERYASLVSSAREDISQRRPGWTWTSLAKLTEAARLETPLRNLLKLRSEAATCLAGVDLRKKRVLYRPYPECALAFRPDGKVLAASHLRGGDASVPRTVLLLDPETGRLLQTLTYPADGTWSQATGKQDGTRSLAFSRDGRWLALGTRSGWICCWDLNEPRPAPRRWKAANVDVDRLLFSPDGASLFSLSRKASILVRWDVAHGGQERARFWAGGQELDGLALPPEGRFLAAYRHDGIVMLDPERLCPVPSPCHQHVVPYCFSPDGRFLAGESNHCILLLEVETGREVRTFQDQEVGRAHDQQLEHLSFSPDGSLLLSASHIDEDRTLKLWEVASGRLLASDVLGTRCFHTVAWHPDGRSLAVSLDDEEIALYEVAGLRERTFLVHHSLPLQAFRFSQDGSLLACTSPAEVTGWAVSSGRLLGRRPTQPPEKSWHLTLHPRARSIAYAVDNARIESWDVDAGKQRLIRVGQEISPLAFAPDGKMLWAVVDGDIVRAWNWPEGRLLFDWKNDVATGLGALYCLAVGRQWALAGGRDGKTRVFRVGEPRFLTSWAGPGSQVRSAAFSPDETLAALGTQQGTVRLVRVPSGETLLDLEGHQGTVEALAFSPDGRLLATGSRDRTIRLYLRDCRQDVSFRHVITLRSPAGPVTDLAFHPDGVRLMFLVHKESALRVWHLERLHDRLAQMGLVEEDWPAVCLHADR